jgi:hypothetical protein
LFVSNTNDPPVVTSVPDTSVNVNEAYLYVFTAHDEDVGDELTYFADTIPAWLSFEPTPDCGILSNTPSVSDTGTYYIVLGASDGMYEITQQYYLTVTGYSSVNDIERSCVQEVFPCPADDYVIFRLSSTDSAQIELFSISGSLQKRAYYQNKDLFTVDISDLPDGIYFYKVLQNNSIGFGKIIKNI